MIQDISFEFQEFCLSFKDREIYYRRFQECSKSQRQIGRLLLWKYQEISSFESPMCITTSMTSTSRIVASRYDNSEKLLIQPRNSLYVKTTLLKSFYTQSKSIKSILFTVNSSPTHLGQFEVRFPKMAALC